MFVLLMNLNVIAFSNSFMHRFSVHLVHVFFFFTSMNLKEAFIILSNFGVRFIFEVGQKQT